MNTLYIPEHPPLHRMPTFSLVLQSFLPHPANEQDFKEGS